MILASFVAATDPTARRNLVVSPGQVGEDDTARANKERSTRGVRSCNLVASLWLTSPDWLFCAVRPLTGQPAATNTAPCLKLAFYGSSPAPARHLFAMDLCTSCKRLNISLASFISHPGTDDNPRLKDPIYELGRLNEFRKKYKTCPFCRLVFAAFQSGPIKRVAELTDLSKIAVFATWINALGSSKAERLKSASLAILVWAESPQIPSGSYKIVLRAVSKMLPDQPHFGHISPTKCSLLDFDQIKHWLRHCQTRHSSCSDMTKPSRPTRHFFVIDVHFKRIVEAPEQCRYLALSYVWGSARQYKLSEDNQEMFRRKDSLKSKYLTTTIRDSIELTDKLGERYLWVDALCIVQDSNAIRQQTLQDMDRIYADSLLTIVAGTCSSANDVLPGVTQERVWTQWYQKVSASLTLSAHFDYKDFLDYAIYSERAWT